MFMRRAGAAMRVALLLLIPLLAGCVQPDPPSYVADEPPAPASAPSAPPAPVAPAAPYAGEEARDIKALSPEEIEGYQKGAGLGYAKPAELNSYPGPLHALEMADRLSLTDAQREEIQRLRQEMLAQAVPLGERYLANEAAIERAFRDGDLDAATLRALLDASGRIESELRYVHLQAHLATRAILTMHQVALYDEARGYGEADHASHEHA